MYRASASLSLNSASVSRFASSDDAPPSINSCQRSSRCCESSSTISSSRVGDRRSDESRPRTSRAQSSLDMFASRDAADGFDECRPRLPLLHEDAPSVGSHLIEAASPLPGLLDPRASDPAALLQPIEQRIEGIDVEPQLAVGPRVDQLAQLVAVAGPRVEQREDEQFGGAFLQLAVEGASVDTCHKQIV